MVHLLLLFFRKTLLLSIVLYFIHFDLDPDLTDTVKSFNLRKEILISELTGSFFYSFFFSANCSWICRKRFQLCGPAIYRSFILYICVAAANLHPVEHGVLRVCEVSALQAASQTL